MKRKWLFIFCMMFAVQGYAQCKKCEEIRENNRNHPEKNTLYYEDYLKSEKGESQTEASKAASATETKASEIAPNANEK